MEFLLQALIVFLLAVGLTWFIAHKLKSVKFIVFMGDKPPLEENERDAALEWVEAQKKRLADAKIFKEKEKPEAVARREKERGN